MSSDLISRQAAIDVADAVWSVTGDKNVAKVWDQIKDLPSVQPVVISKSENTTECEDAVSRFEVLRLIDYSSNDLNDAVDNRYMQNEIKQLPSVTPKQPGWIPVTERLPERYDNYLITTEDEDTDIGTFHPGFKQWSICDADGFRLTDGVLAWCELPKPWEGGQDSDVQRDT